MYDMYRHHEHSRLGYEELYVHHLEATEYCWETLDLSCTLLYGLHCRLSGKFHSMAASIWPIRVVTSCFKVTASGLRADLL
jgi:hypothetical protein